MGLIWTPEKFKKELVVRLAENGQIVGEFVRGDARRRLSGISDPDWGRAYRGFVAGLVSYDVSSSARAVTITVGVRGGYSSHHGFYIETGTRLRPARPWLRPAVFENGGKIVGLLTG